MEKDKRPLSPHLQIYKPQFTSIMSILHRLTGFTSILGLVLISVWLVFTASGRWPEINYFMGNPIIAVILSIWVLTLIYHFCNGIRHLVWDSGKCLTIPQSRMTALIVQIATLVIWAILMAAVWL